MPHKFQLGALVLFASAIYQPLSAIANPLLLPETPLSPQETTPIAPQVPSLEIRPASPLQENPQLPAVPTVKIKEFRFVGNTIFSDAELNTVVSQWIGKELTLEQQREVRDAITKFYVDRGYINSGSVLASSLNKKIDPRNAILSFQIVEGTVEQISITGTKRLVGYIRSRLQRATSPVLNRNRLLEELQWLQTDVRIKQIWAELAPSTRPDRAILNVEVTPNRQQRLEVGLNNQRSPVIGELERRIDFTDTNLFGRGDTLSLTFSNTNGSNAVQARYEIPYNTQNGTVAFDYTYASAAVVQEPFEVLDIINNAQQFNLSVRQPLLRQATATATQEFAIGLTLSRTENGNSLLGIPFPISIGDDAEGKTRINAVRFFQDFQHRGANQILLLRSAFSFGTNLFDSTDNFSPPDGQFFSWAAQGQWIRRLPHNLLLVNRAGVQIADRALLPTEQFTLGGSNSIWGYRQDLLLGDNGAFISTELQIPLYSGKAGDLQIAPYVGVGTIWNYENEFAPQNRFTLAAVGLGLRYTLSDRIFASLNWGIPLNQIGGEGDSWQEQGVQFSLTYRLY